MNELFSLLNKAVIHASMYLFIFIIFSLSLQKIYILTWLFLDIVLIMCLVIIKNPKATPLLSIHKFVLFAGSYFILSFYLIYCILGFYFIYCIFILFYYFLIWFCFIRFLFLYSYIFFFSDVILYFIFLFLSDLIWMWIWMWLCLDIV